MAQAGDGEADPVRGLQPWESAAGPPEQAIATGVERRRRDGRQRGEDFGGRVDGGAVLAVVSGVAATHEVPHWPPLGVGQVVDRPRPPDQLDEVCL